MLKFVNMFLFYSTEIEGDQIQLADEEHVHCTKVLRKKIGETLFITDGKGHIYNTVIEKIQKQSTFCRIQDSQFKESITPEIAIAIAPTKNAARIEWFVEKAVEIGISAIYIIQTSRTEKKAINVLRLEKIIIAAMKQSLNVHMPKIQSFKSLADFMDLVPKNYEQKFIAHCDGPTTMLNKAINHNKSSVLLIGPEGDFTSEEIILAHQNKFSSTSLGDSRLRTETAGLVGLFFMRY